MFPRPRHLLSALLLASSCATASAQEETARAEFVYEVDPYYTNAGYNIPLTDKPIPTIVLDKETLIYRELLKDALIPRYMTLEASVYPMPVLGTWLKTHQRGFYDSAAVSDNFNIIETLTAGFQEPWAVSAFFGNVAKLQRPGDKGKSNNYGYTGYLLSVGTQHIEDNQLVSDDWCELEWKLKGQIEQAARKLSWSFRIGGKFNRNHDINNVTYLSLARNNTELDRPGMDWLDNSSLEFRVHFLQHGGKLVRSELIAGKKFPLRDKGYTPTFSAGFIWTSPDEYSGILRTGTRNKLTFVLRPSLEF